MRRGACCSPRVRTMRRSRRPNDPLSDEFVRAATQQGHRCLFGVNVPRAIGDRLYWIQVGQDLAHRDVIIDDIVASFLPRVAWITFPILLLLLLIDILIFRRALDPVRDASDTAASIGPTSTDVRLSEQSMPTEIVPLVHAVNQALDRLEAGFRAQREFTADMAHELRTPLAIMRARVDSMDDLPLRRSLRGRHRQHDAHGEPGPRHRRTRERSWWTTDSQGRSSGRLFRRGRLHGATRGRQRQDDRADRRRDAGVGARPCRSAVPGGPQSRRECHSPHTGRRGDRGRCRRRTERSGCWTRAPACRAPNARRSSSASGGATARGPRAAAWDWPS